MWVSIDAFTSLTQVKESSEFLSRRFILTLTLDLCILHITFNTFVWLQHTCSDWMCSNTMNITWLNPAELRIWKMGLKFRLIIVLMLQSWTDTLCKCTARIEMCIFTISEWLSVSLQLFLSVSGHFTSLPQSVDFFLPPSQCSVHPSSTLGGFSL